jgi:hypothetical protein
MACPATLINLLNPISIIGLGFIGYSIFCMIKGVTYIYRSDELSEKYRAVHYSEEPISFCISVGLNLIFGIILFDLINNIGIIATFNQVKTHILRP